MEWIKINVAKETDKWRAVVSMVMNIPVPEIAGKFEYLMEYRLLKNGSAQCT